MRARGFRPDPEGTKYRSHFHALQSEPVVLPHSDLSVLRAGLVYQGGIGSCFEEAPKRAIQIRQAAVYPGTPFLVSDMAHYAIYRKFEAHTERPNAKPEQLPSLATIGDTGGYPALALQALQEIGLVREDDWPGPASGRTDWRTMLETEPGDSVLTRAYDARGLEFQSVDLSHGLRNAVLELHPRLCMIMVAINAAPLDHDPGELVVQSIPTSGQDHYVAILSGEDPTVAIMDNWWSCPAAPWGIQSSDRLRGCWRTTWTALERAVSTVLCMTGLPSTLQQKSVQS